MADGDLCIKYQASGLAHKYGGDSLIFKGDDEYKNWALVIVSWTSATTDLDICGYWTALPSEKCGWDWGSGTRAGTYQSVWVTGDDTGAGGQEILHLRIAPWEDGNPRTYRIHFNVYGEGLGGNVSIEVTFRGVKLYKDGQTASTNYGQKTSTASPSCLITFDEDGTPLSIE